MLNNLAIPKYANHFLVILKSSTINLEIILNL